MVPTGCRNYHHNYGTEIEAMMPATYLKEVCLVPVGMRYALCDQIHSTDVVDNLIHPENMKSY